MRRLLVAALALLLAVPAAAQQPADTLPLDPQVRSGTLPNGLRYFVRRNARPENRAELRLVVNAGSVLEADDQRGLAHFLEHMAFNGTRNFPRQALVSYLESIGMRFGADLNAYTGFDETVYMLQVPTDTGTALAKGLEILEDWAHGQLLDVAEIDKERGVVIEEWRLGQGAGERLRRQFFPALLHGSRYVERLPIGDTVVLRTFEPAALARFYRDWYRPDLMAVVAVGDFDAAEVESLIRRRFAGLAAPAPATPRPEFEIPDHAQTLVAIATDPEATSTVVQVFHKLPPQPRGTVDAYRRGIIESLHNTMLNDRLAEIAQRADPPYLGANAGFGGLLRGRSSFSLGAAVAEGGVLRGLNAVLEEAERVRVHGFTDTELGRGKADMLRSYEQAYAERDKSESVGYADEYVRHFLEQEPAPGIAYEYELVKRLVPGITLEEIDALARASISEANRVVVLIAPEHARATLPSEAELLAAIDGAAGRPLQAWADDVSDAPLVERAPAPGRIVAEKSWPAIGVTEWQLSNGARVLLKPTDFKDDQVLLEAVSPGGRSLVPDSIYESALFATAVVGTSGVGAFDAVQLGKQLAGKAASVGPFVNDITEGMQGSASPQDLETMFQLLHLHFTAPRNDSVAFGSYRQRLAASIVNRGANPQAVFSDTITVTLAQHHLRRKPLTAEMLAGVDRDAAYRVYTERFRDAGDFTFALAGAFTLEQVRPLVEQWVASLASSGVKEQPQDRGMRPPKGVVEKVVRRGLEPQGLTQIVITGEFEYTRENRHLLASLAEVLDMRLRDVLREDLGGTYGVNVSQSSQQQPVPGYQVEIGFGAAPERLEELTREVFAQLAALRTTGPAADVVAHVQEQQRRQRETARRTNSFWTSQLLFAARLGEDPDAFLAADALTEALTPERIREAAQRWLDPENYVRVSLLPE